MKAATAVLASGVLAACTSSPAPVVAKPADASPALVSLAELSPSIALDLRYPGYDNFLGRPVDGYRAARCLLTPEAGIALVRVQRDLSGAGLGLVVYDCYRPQRAVDHFARWAADPKDTKTREIYYPGVAKSELIDRGYIARRSSHSRGSTVDVGLAVWGGSARGWQPLDMGTPFDFFDPRSHTDSTEVSDAQRANRSKLRSAMEQRGFENLPQEWWHYTLVGEPYPDTYFDVLVE